MTTNIKIMTEELHKAFQIINDKFFSSEVPLPAITIQSSGNRKLAMGWCTTKEVWRDKQNKQKLYEINLSAEYIDISFEETMDTLMHEMVHLYNIVKGIQDVSRGGTYHNKNFLERAKKSGFEYPSDKPDKRYGYSNVKLKPSTIAILKELDIKKEVFSIGRKSFETLSLMDEDEGIKVESKKKSGYYVWLCPGCNVKVRSTKEEINIKCADCNMKFEIEVE